MSGDVCFLTMLPGVHSALAFIRVIFCQQDINPDHRRHTDRNVPFINMFRCNICIQAVHIHRRVDIQQQEKRGFLDKRLCYSLWHCELQCASSCLFTTQMELVMIPIILFLISAFLPHWNVFIGGTHAYLFKIWTDLTRRCQICCVIMPYSYFEDNVYTVFPLVKQREKSFGTFAG